MLKLRAFRNRVSVVLMASSSNTRLANSSRSPSVDEVVENWELMNDDDFEG